MRMGYCLGKYGTDIFLPIASVKGAKYVLTYSKIKKAEKICNLKTLALSKESKEALESTAARWNAERLAWLERVEIEVDKQSKHIPGKWNYEEGKSIWSISESETKELLKKHAGKGQKIQGELGQAGYRERIDCGKVIGYYIDEKTKEMVPTTMTNIHYSKKGAHFVPAAPKK